MHAIFTLLGTLPDIQQRDLQLIVDSEPHRERDFYHQKCIPLIPYWYKRAGESNAGHLDPQFDTQTTGPARGLLDPRFNHPLISRPSGVIITINN